MPTKIAKPEAVSPSGRFSTFATSKSNNSRINNYRCHFNKKYLSFKYASLPAKLDAKVVTNVNTCSALEVSIYLNILVNSIVI